MTRPLAIALATTAALAASVAAQSDKLQGTTYRAPSGTTLRIMLDESNVGPEVTLGEMIFPPNQDSGTTPTAPKKCSTSFPASSSTSSTARARS